MEVREEVFLQLDEMRRRILSDSRTITAAHQHEVFCMINMFLNLQDIAKYGGLAALEREAKTLAGSDHLTEQMLANGLQMLVDVEEPDVVVSRMFEKFAGNSDNNYMDFMLYICIRFFLMLQSGDSHRTIKAMFLSMIPREEHRRFEQYLKHGFYIMERKDL